MIDSLIMKIGRHDTGSVLPALAIETSTYSAANLLFNYHYAIQETEGMWDLRGRHPFLTRRH